MAHRLQEFRCKSCNHQQEQLLNLASLDSSTWEAQDKCEKCGASSEKLEPVIGLSAHSGHVTWSKWRAV